jgi:hypothetical protein
LQRPYRRSSLIHDPAAKHMRTPYQAWDETAADALGTTRGDFKPRIGCVVLFVAW